MEKEGHTTHTQTCTHVSLLLLLLHSTACYPLNVPPPLRFNPTRVGGGCAVHSESRPNVPGPRSASWKELSGWTEAWGDDVCVCVWWWWWDGGPNIPCSGGGIR